MSDLGIAAGNFEVHVMRSSTRKYSAAPNFGSGKLFGKGRRSGGFTLVELLAVMIIIGLLVTLGLDNFYTAETKAKKSTVMSNMHLLQVATEAYSTDAGGLYGADTTSIAPYLPGGASSLNGNAGAFPTNAFTGQANETPYVETITSSAQITTTRQIGDSPSPGDIGNVGYKPCDNQSSYCVTGTDISKNRVGGANTTLILSNQ
jgi:prepilin-type N-terminal cleavage/methylation domain-containing protein